MGVGECKHVGKGEGIGRRIEQLLSLRNSPNFSEASSDWRMAGSLHGLGKILRLSFVYREHWNMMWWRVWRCGQGGVGV